MSDRSDAERAKRDFLGEAEELLDEISLHLSDLEEALRTGTKKPDSINAIFRGIHSLKGLSGMLGFSRITNLTHDLESLLDEMRMGKIPITTRLIDFLYDCVDTIVGLTEEIAVPNRGEIVDIDAIISGVDEFLSAKVGAQQISILDLIDLDPNIIKVLTEYEEYRLTDNIKLKMNIFSIYANFDFDTFDEKLTALNSELREIGEIITTLPSIEPVSDTSIQFNLIIGTKKEKNWLENVFENYNIKIKFIPYKDKITQKPKIDTISKQPTISSKASEALPIEEVTSLPESKKATLSPIGKTVRVNLEKIDNVLNMIGELAISKSVISKIAFELRSLHGFHQANDLLKITRNLEKQILRMQSRVIEIRMVPLEQLFLKVSRNIKKIAKSMKKKIHIHISGEETELDKMLIEELSDPLLHILRNAIDHGIETPEIRLEKGKSEEGNIWINAFQRGNYVLIEIKDDGAGINLKEIQRKALSMGLIEKNVSLTFEEASQLLFLPGFSTKDKASEISGRGVGMDIVRKNISNMNGTIKLNCEPGQGTRFLLSIPLTMAIISALIIRIGKEKFAIPLSSVSKSMKISNKKIQTLEKGEVIDFAGSPIPILRLNKYFASNEPSTTTKKEKEYLVVVHTADRMMALIVDQLLERQDIVIKSLGKRMQKFPGIAGGTEIGDKKVILVIDIPSLLTEVEKVYSSV